jgi:hypothetical protein
MIFSITQWQQDNLISYVRLNGLNKEYLAYLNSDNQRIRGAGEHKLRIPAFSAGNEIIIPGTQYIVTITIVYSNGEEQTSERFTYIPEIKYLTL